MASRIFGPRRESAVAGAPVGLLPPERSLLDELLGDATQLARASREDSSVARAVLSTDSYRILALHRMRELARRRPFLPGVNHALRVLQSAIFGIEIGKDVTLGSGVYFVHPIGIVIGGDAKVGNRVRFYGNNTVGTAKDNGYPTIADDVVIGAGARILGPITVGARSEIGANAVVLSDVPPDSVVVGIPGRVVSRRQSAEETMEGRHD